MTVPSQATIRPARAVDLACIQGIEAAAFEPARRSSRRALRRALHSSFQKILVAEIDDEVAGFVVLWPFRQTWRVYNLATHPAHRDQGVGKRLLQAALAAAQQAGARRVVLEARATGHLVDYYQRLGFRAQARLPNYYAQGQDALRMELSLS
jgi:ribosomal protein S18 acetylase RimI-like enzyme